MSLTPAAVLVPLITNAEGIPDKVLYTVRSNYVTTHKGQICFPGGTSDPEDATLTHTAIRETREEIGIDVEHSQIIRELPGCPTTSGYNITPVIGLVKKPYQLELSTDEVQEVFAVPIEDLKSQNYGQKLNEFNKIKNLLSIFTETDSPFFTYNGHKIWGATAVITCHLLSYLETSLA